MGMNGNEHEWHGRNKNGWKTEKVMKTELSKYSYKAKKKELKGIELIWEKNPKY